METTSTQIKGDQISPEVASCPLELLTQFVEPLEDPLLMSEFTWTCHSVRIGSLNPALRACTDFQLKVEKVIGINNLKSSMVAKELTLALIDCSEKDAMSFVLDRIRRMGTDKDFNSLFEAGQIHAKNFGNAEVALKFFQEASIVPDEMITVCELRNILCNAVMKETELFYKSKSVDDAFVSSCYAKMFQFYKLIENQTEWDEFLYMFVLTCRKLGNYALKSYQNKTWNLSMGLFNYALNIVRNIKGMEALMAKLLSNKAAALSRLSAMGLAEVSARTLDEAWKIIQNYLINDTFAKYHTRYIIRFLEKASFVFHQAKSYARFLRLLKKVTVIIEKYPTSFMAIEIAHISTMFAFCYCNQNVVETAKKYMEISEQQLKEIKRTNDIKFRGQHYFSHQLTEVLRNQGYCYLKLREFSISEQKCKEAIDLNVSFYGKQYNRVSRLRLDLIKVYVKRGKVRLAQQQLDEIQNISLEDYQYRYKNKIEIYQRRINNQ